MCGIAGIFNPKTQEVPIRETLAGMIAPQLHRGPDGVGYLRGPGIGMAHTRLSIIDLEGGWQPLANEDESVWVILNGEIYNYIELRQDLLEKGHTFVSNSDTEVLVHLYEEKGMVGTLNELNGQYSFALWDRKQNAIYLVRDHVGIHPLHYHSQGEWIRFSSEVKGLLGDTEFPAKLDHKALDQLFTFWGPLSGRSLFKDIHEVPPGHYLKITRQKRTLKQYWEVRFSDDANDNNRSLKSYAEELYSILEDACRLRLRADVPVGTYLSGGLDSSATTYLTQKHSGDKLKTFSVSFEDKDFDESHYQRLLNNSLNTENATINVNYNNIAEVLEKVVWHTEKPVLRTAPAPLFILSKSVSDSGIKTVLTGEGADEFLGGYDIFKEAMLRKFWLRNPGSIARASLFEKLYPYNKNFSSGPTTYLGSYFRHPSKTWDETFSSHWVRWKTTSRIKNFYSSEFKASLNGYDPVEEIQDRYNAALTNLDTLSRAQYLEIATLLPNYLLSSQGDRMAMAHSIEVRFPFLDRRMIEFSCRIPAHYRMLGLNEKAVLKRAMRGKLPKEVLSRYKRPYMAPDIKSFINRDTGVHPLVENHLCERKVREWGIFNPLMVQNLIKKCLLEKTIGFGDNMSFIGILSTQIWLERFLNKRHHPLETASMEVRVDRTLDGDGYGPDC